MNIFDIILVPMGYVLRFAYNLTNNYLISILLFALVIEILLIPLQIKQQKNSIAQAKLQPKVRAITKKYDGRNDKVSMQKKQQETMDLYKRENFSPYSGCLPMLIQLPIILCLYNVITAPLRYITGLSNDAITALGEFLKGKGVTLGGGQQMQMDMINYLQQNGITKEVTAAVPELTKDAVLPNFHLGIFDLSQTPQISQPSWLWAIPVLVFVSMFLSMKLVRKFTYQAPEAQAASNGISMKIMDFAMPLMSTWISFSVPASIGIYWIFRQVVSVVERYILSKVMPIPKMTDEEIKAAEKEADKLAEKRKKEEKPVRSLHTIDFDDDPLPPPVPDDDDDDDDDYRGSDDSKGTLRSALSTSEVKDDRDRNRKKKR